MTWVKLIDILKGKLPNEMRKELYKVSFKACKIKGIRRKDKRQKPPTCVIARIKQLFPSDSDVYMDFKEYLGLPQNNVILVTFYENNIQFSMIYREMIGTYDEIVRRMISRCY